MLSPPLPPYVDELELLSLDEEMDETESKNPLYDICFHLLKLYSDRFVMASSFFADFFINDAVHSCVFMQADFKFFLCLDTIAYNSYLIPAQ